MRLAIAKGLESFVATVGASSWGEVGVLQGLGGGMVSPAPRGCNARRVLMLLMTLSC